MVKGNDVCLTFKVCSDTTTFYIGQIANCSIMAEFLSQGFTKKVDRSSKPWFKQTANQLFAPLSKF